MLITNYLKRVIIYPHLFVLHLTFRAMNKNHIISTPFQAITMLYYSQNVIDKYNLYYYLRRDVNKIK